MVSSCISVDNKFAYGVKAGSALAVSADIGQVSESHPTVYRLGDVPHEVRWLPAESDTLWMDNNSSYIAMQGVAPEGNSVSYAYYGVPKGTVYLELTSVWEVVPGDLAGSSQVQVMRAPPSKNKLNDVLQAIGNITEWATSPPTLSRIGRAARNMYSVAASVAAIL